jgi:hypothetical protein
MQMKFPDFVKIPACIASTVGSVYNEYKKTLCRAGIFTAALKKNLRIHTVFSHFRGTIVLTDPYISCDGCGNRAGCNGGFKWEKPL